MENVAFFDLATFLIGYCVGTGEDLPHADVLEFGQYGEDLGALGLAFWQALDQLHARFGFTVAGYEKPLLLPTDKMLTIRRIYGVGMILETWCAAKGIPCGEETVEAVKKEATGNHRATKLEVAERIERAGIVLPKGPGRLDAGDASAGWLIGVRVWNPKLSPLWDRRIHSAKGARLL